MRMATYYLRGQAILKHQTNKCKRNKTDKRQKESYRHWNGLAHTKDGNLETLGKYLCKTVGRTKRNKDRETQIRK